MNRKWRLRQSCLVCSQQGSKHLRKSLSNQELTTKQTGKRFQWFHQTNNTDFIKNSPNKNTIQTHQNNPWGCSLFWNTNIRNNECHINKLSTIHFGWGKKFFLLYDLFSWYKNIHWAAMMNQILVQARLHYWNRMHSVLGQIAESPRYSWSPHSFRDSCVLSTSLPFWFLLGSW